MPSAGFTDPSVAGSGAAIAAVVVTYGDRRHLLGPTLEGIAGQPAVGRVIVVDNGSAPPAGEDLSRRAAADPRLTVVRHAENLGSAAGFRAGLIAAAKTACPFVWMLDDDTRPEPGAAAALLEAWDAQAGGSPPRPAALLSQRWDAGRYRRENAWSVNAAFGIDLVDVIRQRISTARRAPAAAAAAECGEEVSVRMAPWSGLFFERGLLDRIGLPDERFVSYEEDHEFTLRITAHGGRILVVPGSRLTTLEATWLDRPRPGFVSARLNPGLAEPAESNLDVADRVYYGARNRVYLETRHLVTRRFRYVLNLAAFVCRVALSGLGARTRHNTRWFLAGVADGWRGRLGRRSTTAAR
jgi:GT2 family glycosyltransferase